MTSKNCIALNESQVASALTGDPFVISRLVDEDAIPFGKFVIGDILWVKEPFRLTRDDVPGMWRIFGGGPIPKTPDWDVQYISGCNSADIRIGKLPASRMPKWASRMSVVVEDVRSEFGWGYSKHFLTLRRVCAPEEKSDG